mmetsp:Transcript_17177/g.41163  ORF Transcript_17177/g.41163 Transcript_17177/m.41163 type:complete len:124 (+) Transcript_17177:1-372(+)
MADHKVGFALKHRAAICVDMESMMSINARRRQFLQLNFHHPVPFGTGDDGPCGGIQVYEGAQRVRGDSRYRPDRIVRFTEFEASPRDPWPEHNIHAEKREELEEEEAQATKEVERPNFKIYSR